MKLAATYKYSHFSGDAVVKNTNALTYLSMVGILNLSIKYISFPIVCSVKNCPVRKL